MCDVSTTFKLHIFDCHTTYCQLSFVLTTIFSSVSPITIQRCSSACFARWILKLPLLSCHEAVIKQRYLNAGLALKPFLRLEFPLPSTCVGVISCRRQNVNLWRNSLDWRFKAVDKKWNLLRLELVRTIGI